MPLEPATLADLADVLTARKSTVPRAVYRSLLVQVVGGQPWVFRTSAGPIAIGGLFAWDDGRPAEAWFLSRPGVGPALAGVVLGVRRMLEAQASTHPAGVISRVMPGNVPGERLAVALGFSATGQVEGGLQIWERLT